MKKIFKILSATLAIIAVLVLCGCAPEIPEDTGKEDIENEDTANGDAGNEDAGNEDEGGEDNGNEAGGEGEGEGEVDGEGDGEEEEEEEEEEVVADLPSDFQFVLDFAEGWPFKEECLPAEGQSHTGDFYTYVYKYEVDGKEYAREYEFAFNSMHNVQSYYYDNDETDGNGRAFCYDYESGTSAAAYGYIKFPAVEGRYLKAVKFVHRTPVPEGATGVSAKGYYFTIQEEGFPTHENALASATTTTRAKAGEEYMIPLPLAGVDSKINTYYTLRVRFKDIEFEKITLVYSDKKPSQEVSLSEETYLFAHRGRYSKDASGIFVIPENSLHGIREAALMGYEGVECDVTLLTKDGQMVVNNDATIDRTMRKASDYNTKITGGIRLDALTLEELKRDYVLESTIPDFRLAPPTLEEFLLECKKYNLKPMLHSSYAQAHKLAAEIMGDNWVCFSNGNISIFKAVREYSNCTVLWSISSGSPEEIIAKLDEIGGDCGISTMEYELLTPDFVETIQALGYHVQCSVFPESEELKAIENGVDYILTDRLLPEGYDKNGSILDDILEFGFGNENFDEKEDNYIGIL